MILDNDISLIDRFIAGELNSAEKVEFEMRVKNDLEFAKAVREQKQISDMIAKFGALKMATAFKTDMNSWKQEGFNPYKSNWLLKKQIFTILKIVVTAGIIGGAVYFYLSNSEKKEEIVPIENNDLQEPLEFAPQGPSNSEPSVTEMSITDTMVDQKDNVSLTRLKKSSTEVADMSLNVEDPSTFFVELISQDGAIYTYRIKYDGKERIVNTDDPNLGKTLMQQASDAQQTTKSQPTVVEEK